MAGSKQFADKVAAILVEVVGKQVALELLRRIREEAALPFGNQSVKETITRLQIAVAMATEVR